MDTDMVTVMEVTTEVMAAVGAGLATILDMDSKLEVGAGLLKDGVAIATSTATQLMDTVMVMVVTMVDMAAGVTRVKQSI